MDRKTQKYFELSCRMFKKVPELQTTENLIFCSQAKKSVILKPFNEFSETNYC